MEGAVESDDIPKLFGCDQGKCELYEEEENNTPDKTSEENIPAGWKQGPVPTRDENITAGWKQGNHDYNENISGRSREENIPTGWKQEEVPTRDESGYDSDGNQDPSKSYAVRAMLLEVCCQSYTVRAMLLALLQEGHCTIALSTD